MASISIENCEENANLEAGSIVFYKDIAWCRCTDKNEMNLSRKWRK